MFLWESLLLSSSSKPSNLYSWGYNSNGRTGLNTDALTNTLVPTLADSTKDWSSISAGLDHSLAISDGKLYSFGSNANGRTGLNTITGNTLVPTQVGTSATWVKCSAGNNHSLAIDGTTLYACGAANLYQTGLNIATNTLVFTVVSGTGWTDCSAGRSSSLGIKSGELYGWGDGSSNKLGNGSTATRQVPTKVGSFTDWEKCNIGELHSLGVRSGILYSWGENSYGTGQNSTSASTARPTIAQLQTTLDGVTDISNGGVTSLMIKSGELYSCGLNQYAATGQGTISGNTASFTKIGAFTDWTKCSASRYVSLAIRDTKLYSCGLNTGGRTGLNTITGNTLVPTQVGTDTGWTNCSAGIDHSLAINNGELYSWGASSNGITGQNNTATTYLVPTKIGIFTDWTDCSAGTLHSLAIRDGKLYSFGSNANGRTGLNTITGNTLVPTQVGTDIGWTSCSAGVLHSLAIRNGELYSFGANTNGSTGQNTSTGNTIVPIRIGSGADWIYCFAGKRDTSTVNAGSSFGIRGSGGFGDLYAWGHNANKLGLNNSADILIPTYVDAGKFSKAVCDESHSLFITDATEIFGCGLNSNNRLGFIINNGFITFYSLVSCSNIFQNSTIIDMIHASTTQSFVISEGKLFYAGTCEYNASSVVTRFLRISGYSDWTHCESGGTTGVNDRYMIAIRNNDLYVGGFNNFGRTASNTTTGSLLGLTRINDSIFWQKVSTGSSHALGTGTV
jgi:alpha-tubulin suppressor-like RCC1 family protein